MKKVHTMIFIFLTTLFIISIMFIGIQIVGTNNDWIGFLGGVIGSFIGVFGVYWTMREDQKKREEERKKDLLSQNREVYSDVVKALSEGWLCDISNGLTKIKRSKEWIRLDKNTKESIEKIIFECRESDEDGGFENAIYSYLMIRCGDIFKVEREEFDVSTGVLYKGFSSEIDYLRSLVLVIKIRSNEMIEQLMEPKEFYESKEQFKHDVSRSIHLPINEKQYVKLYCSVLGITKSEQWENYMSKRTITLTLIENLRSSITEKFEKLY